MVSPSPISNPYLSDMMYQGKYDKNAKNGEAAWKLYNFSVNA